MRIQSKTVNGKRIYKGIYKGRIAVSDSLREVISNLLLS